MRQRLDHTVGLVLTCLFLVFATPGCVTTPLPIPPTLTVDADLVEIGYDERGGVSIVGQPGAVEPGGEEIRVTSTSEIDSTVPLFDEVDVGDDGSFRAWVLGDPTEHYFIEHLQSDEDVFVISIAGYSEIDSPDGFETIVVDPGADSDNDGSPDAIDCAPLDETLSGRRCP